MPGGALLHKTRSGIFLQLGVDPILIADVMLFNIEIAQTFSSDKHNVAEAFGKSIF